MQVRVQENPDDFGACGCGRSPTGKCIGWHGLSLEEYQDRLVEYEAQMFGDLPSTSPNQQKNH
jgi:hypothetical protein